MPLRAYNVTRSVYRGYILSNYSPSGKYQDVEPKNLRIKTLMVNSLVLLSPQ